MTLFFDFGGVYGGKDQYRKQRVFAPHADGPCRIAHQRQAEFHGGGVGQPRECIAKRYVCCHRE
jgi:hypothetical protein